MEYPNVSPALFLSRPNRFIAEVLLDGSHTRCHVKNTGRCRELLIPGTTVWLSKNPAPKRKTSYDLIAVQKGSRLINIDSQAPNRVFSEWANTSCLRGSFALCLVRWGFSVYLRLHCQP